MPSKSVLVVVLVVALALVGMSAASPPPEPLCAVCSDQLAESATGHGVELTTGESHLSIRAFENGSSRWRARVELRSGARALRANDSLRRAVVSDAQFGHVGHPTEVTSRVLDNTLVVTYRESNVAHRSMGIVVFDALDGIGDPALLYSGADTAVLHAPDGYRPANQPAGNVTTNATAITWTNGNVPGKFVDVEHTYVAFAPAGTFAAGFRGQLAIAFAVGPTLLLSAFFVSFLPGIVLGGVSSLLVWRMDETASTDERVSLLAVLVAVAAFFVALLGGRALSVYQRFALAFLATTALFFGLGYRARADRRAWGLVTALTATPFLAVLTTTLVERNGPVFDHPTWTVLFAVGGVVAVLVGVPAFFVGQGITRDVESSESLSE